MMGRRRSPRCRPAELPCALPPHPPAQVEETTAASADECKQKCSDAGPACLAYAWCPTGKGCALLLCSPAPAAPQPARLRRLALARLLSLRPLTVTAAFACAHSHALVLAASAAP